MRELVFDHLTDRGEGDVWSVGAAIGGIGMADDLTEGLTKGLVHMYCDVVDASRCIVVLVSAAGHAVGEG